MIPLAGIRSTWFDGRSYYYPKMDSVGSLTYIWTSSPGEDKRWTIGLRVDNPNNYVGSAGALQRALGLSVRCFKDSALGSSSSEGGDT